MLRLLVGPLLLVSKPHLVIFITTGISEHWGPWYDREPRAQPAPASVPSLSAAATRGAAWGQGVCRATVHLETPDFWPSIVYGWLRKVKGCWQSAFYQALTQPEGSVLSGRAQSRHAAETNSLTPVSTCGTTGACFSGQQLW